MLKSAKKFSIYAWGILGYNMLIILWGAFVRATGSGAGCGAHWPLCNGEIIPRAPAVETIIEYTHRISSGLALPLVLLLVIWAWRAYSSGHLVRKASVGALILTITEALVGAGLVLFQMVAENTSIARAYWMIAHLINTFLLLGALSLTAYWSTNSPIVRLNFHSPLGWGLIACLVGMLVLGSSGAVTALGDTLFPSRSLVEGLRQDFSSSSHILVRLRIWHPLIAVVTGAALAGLGVWIRSYSKEGRSTQLSYALIGSFFIQLILGAVNVILLAPVWMQLVHLFVADLVWITLVLTAATVFALPQSVMRPLPHPVQ